MIPGDPKQLEILTVLSSWVESPLILRRRRLFVRLCINTVKLRAFRLVKHIGKGFAIARLRVLHEDMLLWSMSLRRSSRFHEDAHHSFIDGLQIIVDYKRQQLMP
ncbi:hypothetical protein Bca52824_075083 [Brassica carinata]|uniref:Uncharacterized protein n=1 Tax=Brassica carinata TaxID=52824 RepID=A0A8X7PUC9_BRACI|nr:hypothetical protein Bca52824_075083 [Brassica carinata]